MHVRGPRVLPLRRRVRVLAQIAPAATARPRVRRLTRPAVAAPAPLRRPARPAAAAAAPTAAPLVAVEQRAAPHAAGADAASGARAHAAITVPRPAPPGPAGPPAAYTPPAAGTASLSDPGCKRRRAGTSDASTAVGRSSERGPFANGFH